MSSKATTSGPRSPSRARTFTPGRIPAISRTRPTSRASKRTPLIVIAGKEYGSGSSRDWAAKGSALLGIKAVLAQSFERIHRSNLIGMGVLPLEFVDAQSKESLGLTGKETFDLAGFAAALASGFANGKTLTMTATAEDGTGKTFKVQVRIDTPNEALYYQNG